MVGELAHVRPEPPEVPRRRAGDEPLTEGPAFGMAVAAAYDHVVDHRVGLGFADVEAICRTFAVHFKALGGAL